MHSFSKRVISLLFSCMKKYVVNKADEGQTLEKYVKKQLSEVPLSFIYKLFRKKDVRINNHHEDMKSIIHSGDEVSIYITDEKLLEFASKEKAINPSNEVAQYIIYEDDNILLINKPRGMLTQKDKPNGKALDDMVLSYLAYKGEYDPSNKAFTPGPAHRLDRNTGGIIIFGKNVVTLQYLMSIMQDKSLIQKQYTALVKGVINKKGEITAPLKKNSVSSLVKVDSIANGAKEAITLYEPSKIYKDYTLLNCTLLTGRTHQIRVHMAYINHPVIGDNKYGDFVLNKEFETKYKYTNQFLYATFLKFGNLDYPLSYLKNKEFKIDLPNDAIQILDNIC